MPIASLIHAMFRTAAMALLGLFLTACASVPDRAIKVASVRTVQSSDELECMADCLESDDCESCVKSCLRVENPLTLTMGR